MPSLPALVLFCGVYVLAVATPGPGVTTIVARVLACGLKGAPAFIAGFVAGDLIWFTFAATGLTIVAQTFGTVFVIIKYLGVAYLLYLAWKLWTAPVAGSEVKRAENADSSRRLFLAGLALTLGNPKVMVFFLAILPTVIDLQHIGWDGMIIMWALCAVLLSAVLGGYALLAHQARRRVATPRAVRIVNRTCGAAIAGTAAAIAAR
jgi:threonine/homoserine/homoserine lactone efflux protein